MKHFVIYTNLHKDKDMAVTNRIRDYLTSHGGNCQVWVKSGNEEFVLSEDAECMVVLGGDGTMLQAARDLKQSRIPLIGVNLGTLGYMTEIELSALEESLDCLLADRFGVESRMMLSGKVFRRQKDAALQEGQGTAQQEEQGAALQEGCPMNGMVNAAGFDGREQKDWALNDIVISRCGSLQIIKFNILVNGQFLNDYSADGVIITTPTGSTGYNLSAGGPIVEPKARLIMITPICPHTLNQRSIILSPEDVIEIEISQGREGQDQVVEASFDGNHVIHMRTGDRIRIRKSEKTTDIIKLSQAGFLEVLHKKMSES